ncbi:MAG: hypothetical protein QMD66_04610 [Actinomycetota bacterium]|nr:hypothetical protein [Actinomycetota bacterium]
MHRISKILPFLFLCLIILMVVSHTSCVPKRGEKIKEHRKRFMTPKFKIGEIETVIADEIATSKAQELAHLREVESQKIIDFIEGYYKVGFFSPSQWEGGRFTKLGNFFAPQVQETVKTKDFKALCLADLANKVNFIENASAEVSRLWINFDNNLKPALAVAEVGVNAVYVLKSGDKVVLENAATFLLEPSATGDWQIFDYKVDQKLKSQKTK